MKWLLLRFLLLVEFDEDPSEEMGIEAEREAGEAMSMGCEEGDFLSDTRDDDEKGVPLLPTPDTTTRDEDREEEEDVEEALTSSMLGMTMEPAREMDADDDGFVPLPEL